jgi:hypothetical protein
LYFPSKLTCFHDKECLRKLKLIKKKTTPLRIQNIKKVESPLIVREQLGLLVIVIYMVGFFFLGGC